MKKTVIFDLDGTLLNTLEDLTTSTNYALRSNGYNPRTMDEVRRFVGNGIRLLMIRALPGGEDNPDFDKVFRDFRNHYIIHCNDTTHPYPGIPELLDTLNKRGINLAIVSNKADKAVKELTDIYFKDLIHVAIGENEAAGIKKKPAPDTLLEALNQLDGKPSEALYVGDSDVDIDTAKNANVQCISCSWGFRSVSFLKEHNATDIIDNPMALIDYLN
ncbi:MAG: HAD-IIIA family hydrolase [Bacillota bacterium]|nr:HAD-IIIA family hydrolase [Bacillota bacterium]